MGVRESDEVLRSDMSRDMRTSQDQSVSNPLPPTGARLAQTQR